MKIRQTIIVSIFFLATFFSTTSGHGQAYFGIKSGITISDIRSSPDLPADWLIHNPRLTPHFGLFAEFFINDKVYLQTELQYLDKGFRSVFNEIDNVERKLVNRFQSFSIPLLIGFRMDRFRISFGPEVEYLFRTTSEVEGFETTDNFAYEEKRWLFGFNLGLGYQLQDRLSLGLRGNFGFTPISDLTLTNENGATFATSKLYNIALQASIAYRLFGAG